MNFRTDLALERCEILEKKAIEAKQRTLTNKIAKIKGKFGDK